MLPKSLHLANEAVAFVLELVALVALGWWGFNVGRNVAVHVVLGLGAPAVMVVVWAAFAAPKARVLLPMVGVLAVKALVFIVTAIAMYATGWHVAAVVFVVVAFLNAGLAAFDRESLINTH